VRIFCLILKWIVNRLNIPINKYDDKIKQKIQQKVERDLSCHTIWSQDYDDGRTQLRIYCLENRSSEEYRNKTDVVKTYTAQANELLINDMIDYSLNEIKYYEQDKEGGI